MTSNEKPETKDPEPSQNKPQVKPAGMIARGVFFLVFAVSGICVLIACLAYGELWFWRIKRSESPQLFWVLTIGGILGGVIFVFDSVSGIRQGILQLKAKKKYTSDVTPTRTTSADRGDR